MQKTPGKSRRNNVGDGTSTGLQGLDRIDRQILRRLQQDGRLAITQLAREVHLTVTPCFERVRRLESQGYIRGYFAQLDPERLGLGLLAYITINMQQTSADAFERFKMSMMSCDEVLECHMVGGGFDYLLKVRVKDVTAFRRFLTERLVSTDGVHQTHTYFVLERSSRAISSPCRAEPAQARGSRRLS